MMLGRDPSPAEVRNRMAFGCGPSPAPIQSPIHQQEQLVDPNVQELANILKTLQTTQGAGPKAGAGSIKVNDSFAKSWRDFMPPQAPKVSQAPIIPQIPQISVAREVPVISKAPMVRQTPVVSQAPMGRQSSVASQVLAREVSRTSPALMPPLALSAGPRRLVDVAPLVPSAYVRKLCPLFFAGHCALGQNCSDLHPNYDSQSGTFVDRRFTTPEIFHKEVMTRAEKEKERDEALEALIKQSRDEADRKCHDSGSTARMKNRNIRVAAGITVGKNARGEMDWIISNPPPQPRSTPGQDRPNDGSGGIKARRHNR